MNFVTRLFQFHTYFCRNVFKIFEKLNDSRISKFWTVFPLIDMDFKISNYI